MSLYELPENFRSDNNPDYERWLFECARAEWESDQRAREEYLAWCEKEAAEVETEVEEAA